MVDRNEKYVAFFDLDKTLLSVNSSVPLILLAYKKGLMSTGSLAKAVWLSLVYKLNAKDTVAITESMAFWLKGVQESVVADLSERLVNEKLINRFRPKVLREIEKHKANGARIVLLSASLPYTCNPIAKQLKMDDVICSSMEVVDGAFTGKPNGNICIEQEKETQVLHFIKDTQFNLKEAYCYGDSYSDRFVMEICGHPVCVSPDKRLRKLAQSKNWNIL